MKAVKCPVCESVGEIPDPAHLPTFISCYGCQGKGWVEVSEESVADRLRSCEERDL